MKIGENPCLMYFLLYKVLANLYTLYSFIALDFSILDSGRSKFLETFLQKSSDELSNSILKQYKYMQSC